MNCHHVEKSCMQFVLIFVNFCHPCICLKNPFLSLFGGSSEMLCVNECTCCILKFNIKNLSPPHVVPNFFCGRIKILGKKI